VARAADLVKALEDRLALGRRHARPRVGDLDHEAPALDRRRAPHDATAGGEAHSVGEQVREDGDELALVDARRQPAGRVQDEALVALVEQRLEAGRGVADERGDVAVDGLDRHSPVVDPRRLQQVVDLLEQAVGVRADPLDVAPLGRPGVRRREQAAREPEDDRQRGLQLMAGVGHHLAAARMSLAHALGEVTIVVVGTGARGVHQARHRGDPPSLVGSEERG
jgi:chorismate mutase